MGRRLAVYWGGVGCQTGVTAAARWIGWAELRWSAVPWGAVADVLADRAPQWQADLADRLAERADGEWTYALIAALARRVGHPVPATDGVVRGWVTACEAWPLDRPLIDRLRADPFTPRLAPRLFEVPEIGGRLGVPGTSDAPPGATWPGALAALSTEGLLAREERLNACVARLLRGERPAALRAFLQVLTALDPSEDELAARTGDWVRLAIDAPSPVAGRPRGS
jgi:hypothetical protein